MKFHSHHRSVKYVANDAIKQLIKFNCQLTKLTRSNCYADTLQLFKHLLSSPFLKPDHYTLSATLTACAHIPDVRVGNQLHAYSIHAGLKAYPHVTNTLLFHYAKSRDLDSVKRVFGDVDEPDVYSWTTLLSACAKLGEVGYACQVFDKMPRQNVALWNAIITGCTENGRLNIAFDLFLTMHKLGVMPDNYTLASVLSFCSSDLGRQVHSLIIKSGFLDRTSVKNSLVSMYFSCGNVMDAYEVFEEAKVGVCDQITYNAMINGLVSLGWDEEALKTFKDMLEACLRPTELTFLSVMSSCLDENVCLQVHSQTIKAGYERCTAVNNAAMAMYINHGHLKEASKLFEKLEEKDIVAWNTMITGFAQNSFARLAILNYMQMQRGGFRPDEYTIGSLLASTECLGTVHMFQAVVLKSGLELISEATNALISAFSKHGGIKQAYQIFCESFPKNLISWNAIISGFLFNGCPMQAIEQFSDLLNTNIRPDVYTLNIALSCCSSLSALRHGKQVHGYILRFGFFQETFLGNSLISMYAKCGFLNWSKRVFNCMNERDIISWNAIISALGQFGEGKKAVQTFSTMKVESHVVPDYGTFMAVLSACSRAGLVDDGISIFYSMVKDCGFEPAIDHFACVVDLLGRAGYLDEAERLIDGKDIEIDSDVWWALFSACAAYGNIRLGRIVAGFLLKTERNNPTIYVLLSNIHAAAGQWEEAANMRELMKRVGVLKHPGCSWIRS